MRTHPHAGLLLSISFIGGTVQTWLQPEAVRRWLGGKKTIFGSALAACA